MSYIHYEFFYGSIWAHKFTDHIYEIVEKHPKLVLRQIYIGFCEWYPGLLKIQGRASRAYEGNIEIIEGS